MTTDDIAAAIVANMPGVTPGEWAIKERLGKYEAWCDWHSVGPLHLMGGEATADDRHIALCNPNNISALLSERKAMREALEIIAGERRCLDNLMSNSDVARAALQEKTS